MGRLRSAAAAGCSGLRRRQPRPRSSAGQPALFPPLPAASRGSAALMKFSIFDRLAHLSSRAVACPDHATGRLLQSLGRREGWQLGRPLARSYWRIKVPVTAKRAMCSVLGATTPRPARAGGFLLLLLLLLLLLASRSSCVPQHRSSCLYVYAIVCQGTRAAAARGQKPSQAFFPGRIRHKAAERTKNS